MNRVVLLVCLALLTACTNDEPVSTSSTPASSRTPSSSTAAVNNDAATSVGTPGPVPSVTPTDARPGVDVNTTSVAGVRIGTPAAEAERRLRAALGKPMKTPLPGCYGETGHYLSWDALTVFLSDLASGPVLLTGWDVDAGPSRWRWRLPYDVDVGDGMRTALRNVPDAEGAVPTEGGSTGSFVVHTSRAPGLTWTSTTADEDGRVASVNYMGEGCD